MSWEVPCVCGDVGDEHDPKTMACTVSGCPCIYYDPEPEDEEHER